MSDDVFREIRARLDCRELAERGGMRIGRGYFKCPNEACPSHKKRKLTIKCSDGETWTCVAGCGARGDAVDLLSWLYGLDNGEAITRAKALAGLDGPGPPPPPPRRRKKPDKVVIGKADLELRYQALTVATDHYDQVRRAGSRYLDSLAMDPGDLDAVVKWLVVARKYLNKRGFPPMAELPVPIGVVPYWRTGLMQRLELDGGEDLVGAGFRVGLLTRKKVVTEVFRGRLFLPWRDRDGKTVIVKGRAIQELANPCGLSVDDEGQLTYPMHFLRTSDTDPKRPPHVVKPGVPFGWYAASQMIERWEHGRGEPPPTLICEGELDALSAMVSGHPAVGLGGTSGAGRDSLHELVTVPEQWVVLFDGDESGRREAPKLGTELRCRWNTLVDGSDVNDVFQRHGAAGCLVALGEAVAGAAGGDHPPTPPPPKEERPPDTPDTTSIGFPPGWAMKKGRLCKVKWDPEQDKNVYVATGIRSPPAIVWRGQDVRDGSVVVALSGSVVGTAKSAELALSRSIIKEKRLIVAPLAARGFDVDSSTAGVLVSYLSDYEHAFGDRIPYKLGASALGWHGKSFLYGRTCYGPDDLHYIGEEVLAVDALDPKGKAGDWVSGVLEPLQRYPIALFGFYAALAAPVIHHVPGLSGFAIEFAGDSSTGKSTVSSASASAWGDPSTKGGIIRTHYDTINSLEGNAALMRNIPLFLDDAHLMNPPEKARNLVMSWVNGQGKGRMKRSGMSRQEPRQWATVSTITGEGSVLSSTTYSGVAARVISLPPPLRRDSDSEDEDMVEDIRLMDSTMVHHHGHAGRAWVEWLVKGGVAQVLEAYEHFLPIMQRVAPNDGPAQRWAKDLALVTAVGQEAHAVIGGADPTSELLEVAVGYLKTTTVPDHPEEALDLALAWKAMDRRGGVTGDDAAPDSFTTKVWYRDMDDGSVAMAVAELREKFKVQGIDINIVRRVWLERGYIVDREGEPSAGDKVRLASGTTQCVIVRKERAGDSFVASRREDKVVYQ